MHKNGYSGQKKMHNFIKMYLKVLNHSNKVILELQNHFKHRNRIKIYEKLQRNAKWLKNAEIDILLGLVHGIRNTGVGWAFETL